MAKALFIDPQRCTGCLACVVACRDCDSHQGVPMIHVDVIFPERLRQAMPTVCMHCQDAPCVKSCPKEAIKVTEEGIVLSASEELCDSTRHCLYTCPFGVPKQVARNGGQAIMMKCDQCFEGRAPGAAPRCAAVCSTGALTFGEYDEVVAQRRGRPVNEWQFGNQRIRTRVYTFVPPYGDVISIQGEPHYVPEAAYSIPGQEVEAR